MAKRTRSSSTPKNPGQPLPGSLGEGLNEIGPQLLGRRRVAGKNNTPRQRTVSAAWVDPAIEFLKSILPQDAAGRWEHQGIIAHQVACEALQALGQAVAFSGGAIPIADPRLPEVLPRFDDIATAVVRLASQSRLLRYLRLGEAAEANKPTPLKTNVRAGRGTGPAHLAPWAFPAFRSLGLISDGRWTAAAETILWRDSPFEAGIDFATTPRFVQAVDVAVASVPEDIAADILDIVTITKHDVDDLLKFADRHLPTPSSRDDVLRFLQMERCNGLDRLFARRWRLNDGWLSLQESRRALDFRFDPLSIEMRTQFAARYLREFPYLFSWMRKGGE